MHNAITIALTSAVNHLCNGKARTDRRIEGDPHERRVLVDALVQEKAELAELERLVQAKRQQVRRLEWLVEFNVREDADHDGQARDITAAAHVIDQAAHGTLKTREALALVGS